jgi:hypothetical protein
LSGQPDDEKRRQPRGDRHLGFDVDNLDTVERYRANPRDHPGPFPSPGSLARLFGEAQHSAREIGKEYQSIQ